MAKTPDALITPSVIAWARETAGFSIEDAAAKLGVRAVQIGEWEQGVSTPTVRQAREAARVYRRPFAVFFLKEPPKTFRVPHDFRTTRDRKLSTLSSALLAELRRVRFQRRLAAELVESWRVPDMTWVGSESIERDVEEIAASARFRLGVDVQDQCLWQNSYEAFNGWRKAFERIGVLVCQFEGVEIDEARGFSIGETPFPAIVANAKDHPHGRVFTLFHEYGHLLLNEPGICDLLEAEGFRSHNQKVERFCNSFAAAALLPADALLQACGLNRSSRKGNWSLQELANVARIFCVSREAILRRFVTLGTTSFNVYLAVREKLQKEYQQSQDEVGRSEGRGPSPATRAVRRAGPLFVRIVFDAYDRDEITSSDVAEYLGVRTKHFETVLAGLTSEQTEQGAGT